jgi:hypothetical protein
MMRRRRSRRTQRGVTFAILGLSFVGICAVAALSVDEGMIWIQRNKAQVVADSAALAASKDLTMSTDTGEVAAAQTTMRSDVSTIVSAYSNNGKINATASTTFPTTYTPDCASTSSTCTAASVNGGAQMVRVDVKVHEPSVFGGAIGQNGIDVPAHAVAAAEGINSYGHAVPWGVIADQSNPNFSDSTLNADLLFLYDIANKITPASGKLPLYGVYQTQAITLKSTQMSGSTIQTMGNFGPINLNGSQGGNDYATNISYNSSQTVTIGDTLTVLTGNKVGPTGSGITGRLASTNTNFDHYFSTYDDWFYGRASDPTTGQAYAITGYDTATGHAIYADPHIKDPNDARLGVVPLITTPGKNGSATTTVIGFAVFFIEYQVNGNGQGVVTGRFVGMTVDGMGSPSAPTSGAYTVHLVN